MHQKWHNAYEETTHVPFVFSSALFGRRAERVSPPPSDAIKKEAVVS